MYVADLKAAVMRLGRALVQIFAQGETPMTGTYLRREDHILHGSEEQERRLMSAGVARTGIEVAIVNSEDREVPRGQTGEVVVRGRTVMRGYWRQPGATAEALRNGWLHTGDLGYMDTSGYVFILDRKKDMIISGGENIYPAEVESALFGHPAVADVAVIGIPDQRWGEAVKAIVVLKPGATASAEELIAFSRERIARFKSPSSIDFVESLPRNASGKLLKRVLRAPYWQCRVRQVN